MVVLNDATGVRIEQVLFRHSRSSGSETLVRHNSWTQATQTATGSGWILARVACQDVLHLHKPEPATFYSIGITFKCEQSRGNKIGIAAVKYLRGSVMAPVWQRSGITRSTARGIRQTIGVRCIASRSKSPLPRTSSFSRTDCTSLMPARLV